MRTLPILSAALLGATLLGTGAPGAQAQELTCYLARGTMEEAAQRPSPLAEAALTFGNQSAKLCYGAPSANGREIMGGLVPFGEPWRTGANEATALHLPFAASVGGVELEAGSYSLYTIPGESEWEFVLNRNVERWGIPINDEIRGADVGSFTRPVAATDGMVERLTFRWESHGDTMGHLFLEWENTRIEIPVQKTGM